MRRTLSLCCWVWNQTLELRKTAWEQENRRVSFFESKRMLPLWKSEKPELKLVHSQVLQDVSMRVDLAYQAFFRRVKEGAEDSGYPKFKSWRYYDSFTYPQAGTAFKQEFPIDITDAQNCRVLASPNRRTAGNLAKRAGQTCITKQNRHNSTSEWQKSGQNHPILCQWKSPVSRFLILANCDCPR